MRSNEMTAAFEVLRSKCPKAKAGISIGEAQLSRCLRSNANYGYQAQQKNSRHSRLFLDNRDF
jgi:hypothetical protein